MIYQAYQAQADMFAPARAFADLMSTALREPFVSSCVNAYLRGIGGAFELFARTAPTHDHPGYEIDHIEIGGKPVDVFEEHAFATPFGTLLRFRKDMDVDQPKVLIVAPMAGHFSTLLRQTIRVLLPEHDVYVTDWHNARDVPLSAGPFGLDDYIDHLIHFLSRLGPGTHVVGVCQPCAALLAAVSVMAESDHPAQPRSMTLMAGPIDTRISPTTVNEYAVSRDIGWFERNCVGVVPSRYDGAHRRVYPGFMQLAAFLSMNASRHLRAHLDLISHAMRGDFDKAEATRDFYDEYFAVFDLPAEFYLETVQRVFQEHHLPRGILEWRGHRVNPAAIRKTALLTVEGERDDICAPGQTVAAHDLCTGLPASKKRHHLQMGVGHYGVFSGSRWSREIYPIVRDVIAANG